MGSWSTPTPTTPIPLIATFFDHLKWTSFPINLCRFICVCTVFSPKFALLSTLCVVFVSPCNVRLVYKDWFLLAKHHAWLSGGKFRRTQHSRRQTAQATFHTIFVRTRSRHFKQMDIWTECWEARRRRRCPMAKSSTTSSNHVYYIGEE